MKGIDMKKGVILLCVLILFAAGIDVFGENAEQGWVSLFDGTLDGWKASENTASFTIRDGAIFSMSGLWKMQYSPTSS